MRLARRAPYGRPSHMQHVLAAWFRIQGSNPSFLLSSAFPTPNANSIYSVDFVQRLLHDMQLLPRAVVVMLQSTAAAAAIQTTTILFLFNNVSIFQHSLTYQFSKPAYSNSNSYSCRYIYVSLRYKCIYGYKTFCHLRESLLLLLLCLGRACLAANCWYIRHENWNLCFCNWHIAYG